MTLPRYPAYKESGADWLGLVPAHWQVCKFRHSFIESAEKIDGEVVGVMLSVSGYRGIEVKEYDDENRRRLDEDLVGYRVVRPGQLVVNTMWLNYAGLGVSDYEGHVSPAYRSYEIASGFDKRFVHHMMRSEAFVRGYTKFLTGIRPNSLQMSRDDLMAFSVLKPPSDEQKAIATYLDCETAKIDALIAEQEKLIALLAEKRQATISHAVTRGLNPDAPMKDSGVAWLGEVPRHWELTRLRRCLQLNPSKSEVAGHDRAAEVSFIPMEAVGDGGRLDLSRTRPVSELETGYTYFREGDVTVAKITPCFENGKGALMVGLVGGFGFGTTELIVARPLPDRLYPTFLNWLFRSPNFRREGEASMYGAGGQKRVPDDFVRELLWAIPPRSEQELIVHYLDGELVRFNALQAESTRAITLLKERRAALIAAAVTGQIDVRGWVPPERAAAAA